LLPGRVLVADRHDDRLVLAVLMRLVSQTDRRRLAASLELVGEDRRVEVEHLHVAGGYRSATVCDRARATISRSPSYVKALDASVRPIHLASSTSSSWSAGSPDRYRKRKNLTRLGTLRPFRRYQYRTSPR